MIRDPSRHNRGAGQADEWTPARGPGGRLLGIHSHGRDPGLEIIRKVWRGEDPRAASAITLDKYTP